MFVVRIKSKNPTFISVWSGDPGRTHILKDARKYYTAKAAERAMRKLTKQYPNREFSVTEIVLSSTTKSCNLLM